MLGGTKIPLLGLILVAFGGTGVYGVCHYAEIKADQARQISEVLNSMDEMKQEFMNEIRQLKQLNSKQENDVNTLKTSVNSNKQEFMKSYQLLKVQSAQQNTKLSTIQTSSKNFIDKTKCKAAVAFSAGLTVQTVVGNGKTVVYNLIMSNIGSEYNGTTGLFTCQVPGMYTFNVEALADFNKLADLRVYHNNQKIVRLHVSSDQRWNSGSASALLHLRKGDTVQVKSIGTTSRLYDSAQGPHNTFSGIRTPDLLQDCA